MNQALLQHIESIRWSEFAQPEWNKSRSVAQALLCAASATDAKSCSAAYDSLLYAVGNNHAGTYYPVVLAVLPVLESMVQNQAPWPQRVALSVLGDLFASFHPEPGYETAPSSAGPVQVEAEFRSGVRALRPLLEVVANGEGPNALLGQELLSLLNENGD